VQAGNYSLTLTATNGTNDSSITINANVVDDLTPYQINCPSSYSVGYGESAHINFSVASAIAGGVFTVKSLNSSDPSLPAGFSVKTDSATQSELIVSSTVAKGTYNFSIDYSVAKAIVDTTYLSVKVNSISHFFNPQPIIFVDKGNSAVSSVHSTSFVTDADVGSNVVLLPHSGTSLPNGVSFNASTKEIVVNKNSIATGKYFVDVV